ncbi:MAG: lipopolysaccharide biosynthesis protein [Bacillota bacterium]|nr:lipopolysaccharide biosynthesis protein [Bacillota bacterium]
MTEQLKIRVISSMFWKLLERSGTQLAQFILQIVLARLLLPEDYGLIALVAIFILLAQVFVYAGFGTALIQKKEIDETDVSSVFYVGLAAASLFYSVLFLAAPWIARFYDEPQLILLVRVVALGLFCAAFTSVQQALVARRHLFRKLFISSLTAIVLSGLAGVAAAFAGLGVWALVIQQLTNQVLAAILLGLSLRWYPHRQCSLTRIRPLFAFGWKLMLSSLIDTLYTDIRSLIIGKLYAPAMLGYYNRGMQFPKLIVLNINGTIQSVMLPTLSAQQDDLTRVRTLVRRSVTTSSFLLFPTMVGLAVVAEPAIRILLTDKWLPAVPFLQIYCAVYALMPIHTASLQAINALGRSDLYLRIELIKKAIGITTLAISVPFGLMAIAYGAIVSSLSSAVINTWPVRRLLSYGWNEQIRDILPALILSAVMGLAIWPIGMLGLVPWQTMVFQIVAGAALYVGLAVLFRLESLTWLVASLKQWQQSREEST